MTKIIRLKEIKPILKTINIMGQMKHGFIAYSNGNTVVPPVGELQFDKPPGDVHIKYGYIKNDDFYVIKIASGFYENSKFGIASSQGLMLVFNQKTGKPEAILLDEGYLTDVRTAAAGALTAHYMAPKKISAIGIIGSGTQARLQLEYLKHIAANKPVWVWGRHPDSVANFKNDMSGNWTINIAKTPSEVAKNCNLIVTTTPSEIPLLKASDIQPGTHITAIGSDTAMKQELESTLLKKADIVLVDSIPQSKHRGEVFRAILDNQLSESSVIELGTAIQDTALQRTSAHQITIADLTGVAVQDIMIASAIYRNVTKYN